MGTPHHRAEAGPARTDGYHVHVETGRGRGSLTTALVVPEHPVGALASALDLLHDPRGPADLDLRLGSLAAQAPAGTAFLVGLEDQAWIYPSESVAVHRVGDGGEERLEEPQVVPLQAGDVLELAGVESGIVMARLVGESVEARTGRPGEAAAVPASSRPAGAGSRRKLAVPLGILGALGLAFVIGMLRGEPAPEAPRADAFVAVDPEPELPAPDVQEHVLTPLARAEEPTRSWVFRANGPITSSPLVVGDRVLFGSRDSTLYCLDSRSGELDWSIEVGSGIGSSPREARGTCFFGTYGGELIAADVESGRVAWKGATGGKIVSSPCVVGDRVVVGSYDRSVHAFDRKTGEKRWTFPTGGTVRASPEPVGRDAVAVGSGDGTLYCLVAADGRVRWRVRTGAPVLAACAYDAESGLVVVGTQGGNAYGLDAATGEERWKQSLGSEINGQPRFAEGVVLLGTGQGVLRALDPATGEARWKAEAKRGFDARPLVVGDLVVAPAYDGTVHLIGLQDGALREGRALGSEVFSSPAAGKEFVYVGTLGGTFHALPLP